MKSRLKTNVLFDPDVVEYLASLQERYDRDRSWLINALVRHYRSRQEAGQIDLFDPSVRLDTIAGAFGEVTPVR